MHIPWSTLPSRPAPSWLVPLVVCACNQSFVSKVSVDVRTHIGAKRGEYVISVLGGERAVLGRGWLWLRCQYGISPLCTTADGLRPTVVSVAGDHALDLVHVDESVEG